jgi:hypothetical protein
LQSCSFNSEKVNEIKLAIHGRCFFSSAECKALLDMMTQDNDQVKEKCCFFIIFKNKNKNKNKKVSSALLLYPRCVDPGEFGEALGAIKSGSSRQRVADQIRTIAVAQPHPQQQQPNFGYGAAPPPQQFVQPPQPAFGYAAQQAHQPSFGYAAQPQQPHFGYAAQPQQPAIAYVQPQQPAIVYVQPQQPAFGYAFQPQPHIHFTPSGGAPPSTTSAFGVSVGFAKGSAPPSTVAYQSGPQPMDGGSFSGLLSRLSRGFSSDKVNEVKLAINGGSFFTSEQAREILKSVSFDKDQVFETKEKLIFF